MTAMAVEDGEPEPPRAVAHFALLVLIGFMIVASLALSTRPPILSSFNNVAPARDVPAGTLPDYGEDWSVMIHRSDWKPGVARALGRNGAGQGPRLGWVVREWSFLSLPLVATRQSDIAVFREDSYGYRLSGLTDEQQRAVAGQTGPFPFWRYCWGWIAVAAVALFAVAELRWQARRRAALGVL